MGAPQTPPAGVSFSQRQTCISLLFPRPHSQALCEVLCLSYPPHSQNSKLRLRERLALLKTSPLVRGWLGPEHGPTSAWGRPVAWPQSPLAREDWGWSVVMGLAEGSQGPWMALCTVGWVLQDRPYDSLIPGALPGGCWERSGPGLGYSLPSLTCPCSPWGPHQGDPRSP